MNKRDYDGTILAAVWNHRDRDCCSVLFYARTNGAVWRYRFIGGFRLSRLRIAACARRVYRPHAVRTLETKAPAHNK